MTNYGTVLEAGGFLFLYNTDIALIVDIVEAEWPFLESTADRSDSLQLCDEQEQGWTQ